MSRICSGHISFKIRHFLLLWIVREWLWSALQNRESSAQWFLKPLVISLLFFNILQLLAWNMNYVKALNWISSTDGETQKCAGTFLRIHFYDNRSWTNPYLVLLTALRLFLLKRSSQCHEKKFRTETYLRIVRAWRTPLLLAANQL